MANKPGKRALSYADAGVNIDAGNALVEAIKPVVVSTDRPGANTSIGGFGGLFDIKAAGYDDPILVAANDGVGTKLRVAIEANQHHTVGIDLVAMCVNDLIVQGAEPLFFLDYFATGSLDVDQAKQVIDGIGAGCRQARCALIGGETAEMPGIYQSGDYDLAGFAVGACERGKLLPSNNLKPGDKILGLAASGLHSNGFSLVRKIVEVANLDWHKPAPFADDPNISLAHGLLEPTRIYVRSVIAAIKQQSGIAAMAHITGGGFYENIPRMLPKALAARIDLGKIEVPPVFGWLRETGNVNDREMLRTFNCGVGMAVAVDHQHVDDLRAVFVEHGEQVFEIGEIINREKDAVIFDGELAFGS